MMKRPYISYLLAALMFLATSFLSAQNVEFTKDNFPNNRKALNEAIDDIKSGDKLFEMGLWKYAEAYTFYQKANDFNPNNGELNYKLGRCLYVMSEKSMALIHFEKAHKLTPYVKGDVLFWIGKIYHENEEYDKALKNFNDYKLSASKTLPEDLKELNQRIAECNKAKELADKPVRVFIDNIGSSVNTEAPEYGPIVNADESVIFFTSRRPSTTGGQVSPEDGKYFEDIYYTNRNGKEWGFPVNPGAPINTEFHDAVVGLSADGQTLFTYSGENGGDICISTLEGKKWSKPKPISKKINTKYHESGTSLSPDGRRIYFVSDKPGGFGGKDIYVSELDKKENWGEPKLLSGIVNTAFDEESVFAHPDGRTLYFSSKGHNGMGGYDIYKTTMKDGSWIVPVNLGYPINTPGDDVFFSVSASGRHGYFSSARKGGKGDQDIYMITFLGEEKPMINNAKDNLLAWKTKPVSDVVIEKAVAINDVSMILLKGKVVDGVTLNPVAAKIVLTDIEKNEELATFYSNSATGRYLVSLPSGKNYGIAVTAEGFLFHSENFNIPSTAGYAELEKDILLKKIEVGSKIVLRNIFFDFGKASLRPESTYELDRLTSLLNEVPSLVIEISGHTDNVGGDRVNKELSEKRAKSVVDYLIKSGIKSNRLTFVGYGFDQPLAPNDSEANRQLNRRTEFKIIKN